MLKVMVVFSFCLTFYACAFQAPYLKTETGKVIKDCQVVSNQQQLYVISNNLSNIHDRSIKEAFNTWNNILGKEYFVFGSRVDFPPDSPEMGAVLGIGYATNTDLTVSGDTIATSYSVANNNTGCIKRYNIFVNYDTFESRYKNTPSIKIYRAFMHEIGHILGLDHNYSGGIMNSNLYYNTGKLSDAEKNAIKTLYPVSGR